MARRAKPSTPNRNSGIPLGSLTNVPSTGHVKKSSAVKMTGAQKNSLGKPSEWNGSVEFFTCPKWSQTVTAQRV